MNPYFYIFGTLFFTVYGQIVLKWRLSNLKVILPESTFDKVIYLLKLIFDRQIRLFHFSLFYQDQLSLFFLKFKIYTFYSLFASLVAFVALMRLQ